MDHTLLHSLLVSLVAPMFTCISNCCQPIHCTHAGVTIIPLAILDDNYCYVVVDDTSRIAVAIDAADPEAVKVSAVTDIFHSS